MVRKAKKATLKKRALACESAKELIDLIHGVVPEGSECVYRGTPKIYRWRKGTKPNERRINSSIFRKYDKKIDFSEHYQPADNENERIKEDARSYFPPHTTNLEILSDLRHFGGDTTLIDFSRDLFVALFFACDEELGKNGELIIFPIAEAKNADLSYFSSSNNDEHQPPKKMMSLITPTLTQANKARVIAQKSVFIHAPKGFISPNSCEIIPIKKELKESILKFLKRFHDIDERTIYPDLHGFIAAQNRFTSPRMHFYAGNAFFEQKNYKKAILEYDETIRLRPDYAVAYHNRGLARFGLEQYERAIDDHTEAIRIEPDYAQAYHNRGVAYFRLEQHEKALDDFTEAIRIRADYAMAYRNRGAVWEMLEENEKAEVDFAKAEEFDPKQPNEGDDSDSDEG